jgi:beta-lactamase family protein
MPVAIPIGPLVPLLIPDPDLDARLRPIAAKASTGGLAIVDLNPTGIVARLGSSRGTQQFYVASVAKLAIMVSAFLLREQLKAFGLSISATRASDLMTQFDAAYRRSTSTRFRAGPDFPNLGNVFSVQDRKSTLESWSVEFKVDQPAPRNPTPGMKISPGVGFSDRLTLAIAVSNNEAASRCIRDIGFQYIHGAMEDLGLFNPSTGGIWLGKAYDSTRAWLPPPNGGSVQSANALSLSMLVTAVDRGRLINASASAEMRMLMSQSGSFISNALKGGKSTSQVEYVKDGLDAGLTSEVAVCRKSTGARYCAVIIGMSNQSIFNASAMAMDGLF